MTDGSALAAVRALGERAADRPWSEKQMAGWRVGQIDDCAYAAQAVNNYEALVEALEEDQRVYEALQTCGDCVTDLCDEHAAATREAIRKRLALLATIKREATEAMG